MPFKLSWNMTAQGVATLLQMFNAYGAFLPVKYQALGAGILGGLQLIVAALAHYSNPDGTPAAMPYKPTFGSPPGPNLRFLIPFVALLPLLSACAGPALGKVQAFAETDLKAALADATAQSDAEAIACYSTLLAVLPSLAQAVPPAPVGVVSAFQATRDVVTAGTSGVSALAKRINLGCAALFVDANATLLKLGTLPFAGK